MRIIPYLPKFFCVPKQFDSPEQEAEVDRIYDIWPGTKRNEISEYILIRDNIVERNHSEIKYLKPRVFLAVMKHYEDILEI